MTSQTVSKPWVVPGREAAAAIVVERERRKGVPITEIVVAEYLSTGLGDDGLSVRTAIAGARLGYLAGLRAAKELSSEYDGAGMSPGDGYHTQLGDAWRTRGDIVKAITALIAEAEAGE